MVENRAYFIWKLSENGQLELYDMNNSLLCLKMEIANYGCKETLLEMQAEMKHYWKNWLKRFAELAGEGSLMSTRLQLGVLLWETGTSLEYTLRKNQEVIWQQDVLRSCSYCLIVKKILDYRQIAKINHLCNWLAGLDLLMEIHTATMQDLTQTGRLSSVDPNLQNIPAWLNKALDLEGFVPEWRDSVLLSLTIHRLNCAFATFLRMSTWLAPSKRGQISTLTATRAWHWASW